MTSAQDKRYAAILRTVNRFINPDTGKFKPGVFRAELGKEIRDLHSLGRTDRWHAAISRWQEMVEDEENDLHWAFLQGSIFAGHAA